MSGVNKVILIGNLGKDPEIKALDSGVKFARFSLATSEPYTNKDGEKVDNVEWHNIVLWRAVAEVAEKFLKKGSQVYIEGKLQTRNYEDKDGVTRYTTEVVGFKLTMLGSKQGSGSASTPPDPQSDVEVYTNKNEAPDETPVAAGGNDDDLPF